jgi:uncharacterized membrane protein SpoIIM required for sporulation
MVFFTVMAAIPMMMKMIMFEEKKLFARPKSENHKDALMFFVALFLGMVSAYTLFFVMMPEETVKTLFNIQISTINGVNTHIVETISGKFLGGIFPIIVLNNLKVMIFALLFSFIYGSGAIFILTWNASVISVAIGTLIRDLISSAAIGAGAVGIGSYFSAVTVGLSRYLIHALPEIGAFFVAGLAGGLISIGMLRYELFDKNFELIAKDALFLTLVASILIVLAAVIEVSVSPLIYS